MMAEGPPNNKEEKEMSLAKEVSPGGQGQSQEQLKTEKTEQGSRSLGACRQRQKLEAKTASSVLAPPVWNMAATRPKKMGTQLPLPRVLREPAHGDAHEYSGGFQGMWFQYERNMEADVVAEIGLEELNGLEMEIIRRQLRAITGHLQALEDQGATWHHRQALLFTMLASSCVINLWLWMRH